MTKNHRGTHVLVMGDAHDDARYRATFEQIAIGIAHTARDGTLLDVNPALCTMLGYSRDHLLQRRLRDLLVDAGRGALAGSRSGDDYDERLVTGEIGSYCCIEQYRQSSGAAVWVQRTVAVRGEEALAPYLLHFIEDITARTRAEQQRRTERKRAHARILRLNQLYRTLSHTSALIVRAADRDTLFTGICRIAKEQGGFPLPWVGLVDAQKGTLELQPHAEENAFDLIQPSMDSHVLEGTGPIATAVREARMVVCNDGVSDGLTAAWRELYARHGIRALAVLPLMRERSVTGVFVLNSSVTDYFDDDIQQLLREMVGELSHALDRLRLEQKHVEAERLLAFLAHYDQLTSLPNRGLFYDRLAHGITHAARNGWIVGVLFIDLDRFKHVNDTVGHTAGDSVLHQVAARLLECVRAEDTVARLGSDEFAIVLAQISESADAGVVASKILRRLKQPYKAAGVEVVVSASIGISLYPGDGATPDVLMANAGVAMYNAQACGRDNYQFYTAEMNARALAKLQLESRLRGALERNEFVLHFQPKIAIESGRICGFEALLRWQPPGEPLVGPGDFIPLLEESGLIMPVGEWVVLAACAQIAAWRRRGCELVPIAINVSARQLRHGRFREAVAKALDEHAVEASLIEVEITESSLMENPEEAQQALRELKTVGVTLAIDDFGTGYSSLAYLKRFPFDTLKIDRSFVRDVETDPDNATIARTIIALGAHLSLTVIAEGVETQEQLGFFAANRCDQAQGFLFCVPVPPERATELLRSGVLLHRPVCRGVHTPTPAVLVFGTERDPLIYVQQLLQRDGYQVLTASCMSDALEVLVSQDVVVAIADESARDMSAGEFLRRVRAIRPRVVRIVLRSATDRRTLAHAFGEGAAHKAVMSGRDDELLRDEVRRVVRRRYRPPGSIRKSTRKAAWGLKGRGRGAVS